MDLVHERTTAAPKRDWMFWCIILSLFIPTLLTAVELTGIGTALPVIVNDLNGSQFVWVGSAYTLGATALLPFCGGLAQIFGRRIVMLLALLLFSIGSAVAGASTSMGMLIAGRTVQGLGGGAITALVQIILADLVPLLERGTFNGLMALAWTVGGGSGPVIGGALAQRGQWRWLFYLNLPICGLSALLVAFCLRLRTPEAPLREKLKTMDLIGNAIIVGSSTAVVIGLSWGGVQYAWSSARVLVPLILGLLGFIVFGVYEAYGASHPIVPTFLVTNRTALSGYIQNFIMGLLMAGLSYWLPVYFQACKDASPTASGVDAFGLSFTISPSSIITGITVQATHAYRPQMWLAWVLMLLGTGLLSSLSADGSRAQAYGFQVLAGIGIGIVYVAAYFPVLAPIPVRQSTPALSFHTFLRNFAQVWGVTIGGAVLQNELTRRLPPAFLARFPQGTEVAFAAIPLVHGLPQPLRDDVRAAFAGAMAVVWQVLAGIGGIGLFASLMMKALPLHTEVDRDYGRKDGQGKSEGSEA
ncbi:iron permease [Vararia minispora EC-137]|uniref:Iron permease n=1 Tax=Vararia minispora EC-137 TaxID=1314806 RepID=A0ACB8Q4T0_9AGAM|nr:iron permease [Vararia minispora EC-137]